MQLTLFEELFHTNKFLFNHLQSPELQLACCTNLVESFITSLSKKRKEKSTKQRPYPPRLASLSSWDKRNDKLSLHATYRDSFESTATTMSLIHLSIDWKVVFTRILGTSALNPEHKSFLEMAPYGPALWANNWQPVCKVCTKFDVYVIRKGSQDKLWTPYKTFSPSPTIHRRIYWFAQTFVYINHTISHVYDQKIGLFLFKVCQKWHEEQQWGLQEYQFGFAVHQLRTSKGPLWAGHHKCFY